MILNVKEKVSQNSKRTVPIITILSLFIFVSCRQKPSNDYDKLIIGEWKYVREHSKVQTGDFPQPPSWGLFTVGYNFLPDNICENKLGYFKRIEGNGRHDRKTLFLGTTSKYKIDNDSLMIYNLIDSTWISQKIVSISADTMTLKKNDSTFFKYAKANYHIDESEHYDKIIISASGCYGTCPVNDILINKSGQVIYFGYKFNTVNGYFKSKISSKIFSKLENDFKKANIKKLQDNYSAVWTDDETISVTFIRDNKVVKSISDYGSQAPTEFYWAYTSARYLYQKIPLDTFFNHLNYSPFKYTMLERDGKVCELSQSEGFYLWTLLLNSKETNKEFSAKYLIVNRGKEEDKEVKTDGQQFRFTDKNGLTKTYDLGFNFITTNGLEERFRPKNSYD